MRSAAAPPLSIRLMQRASAAASPATSRSTISPAATTGLFAAVSDNDEGVSKAELPPQQAHDLAVRHADLGGFDDPLVDILVRAVGSALERVESAGDVGLIA